MATELEVSLRTLYRDIADLITDGVPIRGEAGVGYILGEGYDLPPLMFNADEMEAVMLGLSWVERSGDPDLRRAAADTVSKIATVLPEHLRQSFYDAPLMAAPTGRLAVDTIDVAAVRQAIRNQSKVEIQYRDENGSATSRVIWPIGISYFDAQRIIIAWCEMRNGFRHFRADRVAHMKISEDKYRERRQQLLVRWKAEREIENKRSEP